MARVTKIHDFVYFSICLVPMKLFLKKELWNFEKLKKKNFTVSTPKGPPFGKKIQKSKNLGFFPKNHTFLLESELYMFSAFFWGIKHFSSSKFEILTFFSLNNLIFDLWHLTAHSSKSIKMKRLFLVSMEGQRSKYSSENKFWAVSSQFCQLIKRKIGAGWFDPPSR